MVSTATQRPNGERFDFKRFTERPGRVVAEGELVLGSGDSRIDLRADRLAVSQLPDRWVMLSGNGGLRLADGRLAISGDLHGDAAYVEVAGTGQPTLSSDVVIVDRRKDSGGRATPRRTPPRLALDLRVDLGDNFYFRGAGIESRLAGAVRLTAESQEQIRGTGSVHTVSGTFDAYGQELAIERGILNFNGLMTDPGLNVRAIRKNLPVEAGVEVSGTVNDPVVRLVSTPDVPDAEKLSWMVLGRGPNQTLGSQDASLLLSAAMALRGNQGKGPLESLMRGLGLEELSVTSGTSGGLSSSFPTTTVAGSLAQGSSATVTEQIATVGKRIGTHTVVSYERSLSSAENVIKVTYEVTRGLSLIGRVGASATLGLLYTFSFGAAKNDGVPTDAGPPPPPPSVAH
nr:translocation/assembly module TamB domain-containing protein [Propionivibrio soli]